LLRWLIPVFLTVALAGSAMLAAQGHPFFQFVTSGSLGLLLVAMLGARQPNKNNLPAWQSLPYYFVMVNLYALKGIIRALQGQTQVTWQSARLGKNVATNHDGKLPLHPLWWCALGALAFAFLVGW
jgi:hypothetical protein